MEGAGGGNPIYPDFVVQKGEPGENRPVAKVLVVESKGKQLKGNEDTNHKREIGKAFQEVGQQVTWQEPGAGFQNETFRFQVLDEGEYTDTDWRADLQKIFCRLDPSPVRSKRRALTAKGKRRVNLRKFGRDVIPRKSCDARRR